MYRLLLVFALIAIAHGCDLQRSRVQEARDEAHHRLNHAFFIRHEASNLCFIATLSYGNNWHFSRVPEVLCDDFAPTP